MRIHPDDDGFHYSSDAEWDREGARQIGSFHPDRPWILSDRDVWYANPFYEGLPVPHPEDDEDYEAWAADPVAWGEAELARRRAPRPPAQVAIDYGDDVPF
jgi:hypothetical protein